MPIYPLGTDLTEEEAALALALPWLAERQENPLALLQLAWSGRRIAKQPQLQKPLHRMGLLQPKGTKARFYQALVAAALTEALRSGRPLFPASA